MGWVLESEILSAAGLDTRQPRPCMLDWAREQFHERTRRFGQSGKVTLFGISNAWLAVALMGFSDRKRIIYSTANEGMYPASPNSSASMVSTRLAARKNVGIS